MNELTLKEKLEKLDYYTDLDNKGKVIHYYKFDNFLSSIEILEKLTGEKVKDYGFDKNKDTQSRDIKKYNYEAHYQNFNKNLASKYKYYTKLSPKKFEKYRDEKDKKRNEDYDCDNTIGISGEVVNDIASHNKKSGSKSMYPPHFESKVKNTSANTSANTEEVIYIFDIGREFLNRYPIHLWEESVILGNTKIKCECGRAVNKNCLQRHLKTKTHLKKMEKLEKK